MAGCVLVIPGEGHTSKIHSTSCGEGQSGYKAGSCNAPLFSCSWCSLLMMELVTKDALLTSPARHPSGWRRRWRCSWPKRRRAAGRTSSRRLCWNFLMHSSLLADYWNCLCFARDSHQSMSIAMHLHHRNAESSWGRILRSLGHLVFPALLSLFKGTHCLYNSPKVSSWLSEGILTVVVGICWKQRIRMPRRIWKVVPRISLVAAEAAAHGCLDNILYIQMHI